MKRFLLKKSTFEQKDSEGNTSSVNSSTELIQVEKEHFYMVFTKYINWIYGLRSGKTLALLLKLLDMMEYNTGIIDLSPTNRQLIMMELDMSQSSLTQCIGRLLEKEAIYRRQIVNQKTGEVIEARSSFVINPIMFWKGQNNERVALKVKFETMQDIDEDALMKEGYKMISVSEDED